jgi:hypothetical protein
MRTIRILLQTTIPFAEDDWNVGRFSLLAEELRGISDAATGTRVEVVARDRASADDDPVLARVDTSDFDEVWLLGVDVGRGLTTTERDALVRFRERGGGLLTMRDHQDLGSCLATLPGPGMAHYFRTQNVDPVVANRCDDDHFSKGISWPNYHSGKNGDVQRVTPVQPTHPLLLRSASEGDAIEFFPAHPHEGALGVPAGDEGTARVIATGKSLITNHTFNLLVAFERQESPTGKKLGRAVAESSFHHFADYNWNLERGAPSFVDDPTGSAIDVASGSSPEPLLEEFDGGRHGGWVDPSRGVGQYRELAVL